MKKKKEFLQNLKIIWKLKRMSILINYKYYLARYKYYVYPVFVFLTLFFILLLLKLFQEEAINLVEEQKKIPVILKSSIQKK